MSAIRDRRKGKVEENFENRVGIEKIMLSQQVKKGQETENNCVNSFLFVESLIKEI